MPFEGERVVVSPNRMAVLSARGDDTSAWAGELPTGRTSRGSCVLLLHFPTPWGSRSRIAGAYLILEPLPGAPPIAEDVSLSVSRILEPWVAGEVSYRRQPRLAPASAVTRTGPDLGRSLRIDVTALVQRWGDGRSGDHGMALVAETAGLATTSFDLGGSGAQGLRLDVYFR